MIEMLDRLKLVESNNKWEVKLNEDKIKVQVKMVKI